MFSKVELKMNWIIHLVKFMKNDYNFVFYVVERSYDCFSVFI